MLADLAESSRTDVGRVPFAEQGDAQKVFSESQVNSGGFDAYFRYTEADAIAYAPIALRQIGALQCSAIVERAFLGDMPSARDAREEFLDGLGDEAFEELDHAFLAYPDDLTELLFAFVSKRPETFGPI